MLTILVELNPTTKNGSHSNQLNLVALRYITLMLEVIAHQQRWSQSGDKIDYSLWFHVLERT